VALSLSDLLLEASRVLIGSGLSVWIGGAVLLAVSSSRTDAAFSSKGGTQAGEETGSEAIGRLLDRLKFVAAGGLLVGLLLEAQVLGSSLAPRHVVRAGVLFLLVASHVYAVMVVQPKMRYYREKSPAFEEKNRMNDPWRTKFQRERRKNGIVSLVGLLLAVVSLVLG
jgi:hypothetical protein